MSSVAKEYNWNLNYGGIALMWRGGCIIRSAFLGDIKKAFEKNSKLSNLMLDPENRADGQVNENLFVASMQEETASENMKVAPTGFTHDSQRLIVCEFIATPGRDSPTPSSRTTWLRCQT